MSPKVHISKRIYSQRLERSDNPTPEDTLAYVHEEINYRLKPNIQIQIQTITPP